MRHTREDIRYAYVCSNGVRCINTYCGRDHGIKKPIYYPLRYDFVRNSHDLSCIQPDVVDGGRKEVDRFLCWILRRVQTVVASWLVKSSSASLEALQLARPKFLLHLSQTLTGRYEIPL